MLNGALTEVSSFFKGYKPALFLKTNEPNVSPFLTELIEHYPYITENIDLFPGEFHLFFQNEKLKMNFQQAAKGVHHRSPEFNEVLGNALGYPPLGVAFYTQVAKEVNPQVKERLRLRKIGLHYCGISCSSSIDDLITNTRWLWDQYPYEEGVNAGLTVRVDTKLIHVLYGDFKRLEEIQNDVIKGTLKQLVV